MFLCASSQLIPSRLAFRWVWMPLIQAELDLFAYRYNTSRKRANRNTLLPHGRPKFIHEFPEQFNGLDYKVCTSRSTPWNHNCDSCFRFQLHLQWWRRFVCVMQTPHTLSFSGFHPAFMNRQTACTDNWDHLLSLEARPGIVIMAWWDISGRPTCILT